MTDILDCLIIGAGFGGIGLAITLRRHGIENIRILEKSNGAGGCWRQNHYPGAACDVPSQLYSFSFEPNPDWSRRYAPQSEIQAYIEHCADKYGITPLCRYNCEVRRAAFDAARGLWQVETVQGETWLARTLVAGTGQLSQPAYPSLPGRERFEGLQFHSAEWPAQPALQGRRIGVIGSGASAIQFVPELAREAGALYLFQRSAPYLLDKDDRPYSEREKRLFRRFPTLQRLARRVQYWQHEARFLAFGGNPWVMRVFTRKCLNKLAREVHDPRVRAKLVPDYPMGCKRILIANNFYPVFNQSNVHLETGALEAITASGVRLKDGREIPLDVIVYGTGFQSTAFLTPIEVLGVQGKSLNEAWREGAEAFLGISVAGFPNLFVLYGPNTNLGHNSILAMLEAQFSYVAQCVTHIRESGVRVFDLRESVQSAFNQRLQERLRQTVWGGACHNWYKTASGKITNNWYGFVTSYRRLTRRPDYNNYQEIPDS